MRVGDPKAADTDLGPVSSLQHREKVGVRTCGVQSSMALACKLLCAVREVLTLRPPPPGSTPNINLLLGQVESYIQLAKDLGGTILCGGDRPALPAPFSEGAFVNPCVIAVRRATLHAAPTPHTPTHTPHLPPFLSMPLSLSGLQPHPSVCPRPPQSMPPWACTAPVCLCTVVQ
jgi:hypothetical protein